MINDWTKVSVPLLIDQSNLDDVAYSLKIILVSHRRRQVERLHTGTHFAELGKRRLSSFSIEILRHTRK